MNNNNNKHTPPKVTVVMPVYNVQRYLPESIESVLKQSLTDFELIIVDDGSTDDSYQICQNLVRLDRRVLILSQKNRGLSGARNTGIIASKGRYIAFLDSDDIWHKDKLKYHVSLLDRNPEVGVSYCNSTFIDDDSQPIGLSQNPKLNDIAAKDILLKNPIGNGSVPVIRRETLEQIVFQQTENRVNYFDESLRQSEDIECWIRIISTTDWRFKGIDQKLTYYRINNSGLSANINKQFKSWEKAQEKMSAYAPELIKQHGVLAKAYQYRYLARRAVRSGDIKGALRMSVKSLLSHPSILIKDPSRTLVTLGATICLSILPNSLYKKFENFVISITYQNK
jgi:glycosyltransferase involved in cell wall biosynthesis